VEALSPQQRASIHAQIGEQLLAAGAHLVIEGVWDLPCAVQQIEERMLHGETPLA
jgi:phosphonoacetaldehyde hydrolase